jgi:hypothetical protein
MSKKIDAFITEIRGRPRFAAAAASDPIWSAHLDAIEFALNEIDRRADSDPLMLDAFDRAVAIISDSARPVKQRLLDLSALLAPLRDQLQGVRH